MHAITRADVPELHRFEGIPSTAVTILQVGCLQDATIQATINARLSDHRQCDLKSGVRLSSPLHPDMPAHKDSACMLAVTCLPPSPSS